jgi:hypothetical protein
LAKMKKPDIIYLNHNEKIVMTLAALGHDGLPWVG